MNRLINTAMAMWEAIRATSPNYLIAPELRLAIEAGGGLWHLRTEAHKYLLDHGIPIINDRGRDGVGGKWFLAMSAQQFQRYRDLTLQDDYSEIRSQARASRRLVGLGSRRVHLAIQGDAVVLGERLGMTPEEVVGELLPLDLPRAWIPTPG